MVMYATLVVFQRDLDSIVMVVGQVRVMYRHMWMTACMAHVRVLLFNAARERSAEPDPQTQHPAEPTGRRAHERLRHALGPLAVHRVLRGLRGRLHAQTVRLSRFCGCSLSSSTRIHLPPSSVCRLNSHRKLEQSLTIIGAVVLALVVCVSRVRLGYHSKEQVAVGALVGALAGVAWQLFVAKVQRAILTTSHTLASHYE